MHQIIIVKSEKSVRVREHLEHFAIRHFLFKLSQLMPQINSCVNVFQWRWRHDGKKEGNEHNNRQQQQRTLGGYRTLYVI